MRKSEGRERIEDEGVGDVRERVRERTDHADGLCVRECVCMHVCVCVYVYICVCERERTDHADGLVFSDSEFVYFRLIAILEKRRSHKWFS